MKTPILPISFEDLTAISGLSEQLGYPNKVRDLERRFQELSKLPHHGLFKILEGDVPKGWMHLEKVYDLIEEAKVEIKAIVVDEKSRGSGLGKLLIDFAKTWARTEGLNTIYLSCNIVRQQTHNFYKREGFALTKTSHFFELEL